MNIIFYIISGIFFQLQNMHIIIDFWNICAHEDFLMNVIYKFEKKKLLNFVFM
jgi:hypothetical protein